MIIYGTAIVAACFFAGSFVGEVLGQLLHIDSNVGGVGFAMFFLLLATNYLLPKSKMNPETERGITFWQGMYIPVAIAMAASQNVISAVSGGLIAIIAGVLAVAVGMALIPVIGKLVKSSDPELDDPTAKGE